MKLNEISISVLRELSVIKLYELKYIDQETFFTLVTGCGEQTEFEEGRDRLIYYLKLVADSDKDENQRGFDYFIGRYS
ncbi:MAG: hypothetical protein ACLRPU_00260 [Enterococcus hulanensis]